MNDRLVVFLGLDFYEDRKGADVMLLIEVISPCGAAEGPNEKQKFEGFREIFNFGLIT